MQRGRRRTGLNALKARVRVRGLQAAGVWNQNRGEFTGLQGSGVGNLSTGNFRGLQAAGVINLARADVTGMQAAGVVNRAENVRGAQAGLINIAGGEVRLVVPLPAADDGAVGAAPLP